MNFKVGDQLHSRVPKCLGRSSFGHSVRDCERFLAQSEKDGGHQGGGGSPGGVRFGVLSLL